MYKIVKAECLADKIYLMDVEAPRVAKACQPGEFVIVKMDEAGERIPLTICDFDREKGLVTIVFQTVGASTERMAGFKAGDYFQDFVGPLGQPSEFVKEDLEEVKKLMKDIYGDSVTYQNCVNDQTGEEYKICYTVSRDMYIF